VLFQPLSRGEQPVLNRRDGELHGFGRHIVFVDGDSFRRNMDLDYDRLRHGQLVRKLQ
jgi:hypothetical protein